MKCFHKFVDGFGAMGDALVCVKCGYSKYPEILGRFYKMFSTIVPNDGTYMCRADYPYVVKFEKRITWNTDFPEWTHFFDKDGALRPRREM